MSRKNPLEMNKNAPGREILAGAFVTKSYLLKMSRASKCMEVWLPDFTSLPKP